jgi:predicted hydrocarbon binding protein
MDDEFDFERYWLDKFSTCLRETAGEHVQERVMLGSDGLSAKSSPEDVVSWTQGAMERLERLIDAEGVNTIMTGCACQYPQGDLADIKAEYQKGGDIDRVHGMLQEKFEVFLLEVLKLDASMAAEIVSRGWGLAGVRQGDTIIATKIPKSGFLVDYMNETNPEVRRSYYCHCPRVRDALKLGESLPKVYCYCGAGYYKGIWEGILGEPVEVEVLESVLSGDEVCKVVVKLPGHSVD